MAKQASRTMIGGFVVIAVIIMAASLVVFGSGKFFQKTNKYVLYFNESVTGLSVGAPVLFQGVKVGSVTEISLQADLVNMKTQIPVIIEVDTERWKVRAGKRDYRKVAEKLIEMGLRAQLITQSFITGQLAIQLDFYSKAAICYAPAQIDQDFQGYVVIPTCPSTAAKLSNALAQLDFQSLEKHLESAMDGIAKLANNPNLPASLKALKETLQNTQKLIAKVDQQVEPLTKEAKKTVNDLGKLARNLDGQVSGVATGLDKTMSSARSVFSEDSPLLANLENTLQELSRMSRSLRQLADYIDQHPESLIRGKGKPGGKAQ